MNPLERQKFGAPEGFFDGKRFVTATVAVTGPCFY
jgi:hypothetical protein